jgi:hypothetical protein
VRERMGGPLQGENGRAARIVVRGSEGGFKRGGGAVRRGERRGGPERPKNGSEGGEGRF